MKAYLNGEEYIFSGGGSSQEIYSTEETRIGTWIDGKPLYRRMFTVSSGEYLSSRVILPTNEIERLVHAWVRTDNPETLDYDWIGPNGAMYVYRRAEGVCMHNASPDTYWKNRPCEIEIEYTKTTDEAEL